MFFIVYFIEYFPLLWHTCDFGHFKSFFGFLIIYLFILFYGFICKYFTLIFFIQHVCQINTIKVVNMAFVLYYNSSKISF